MADDLFSKLTESQRKEYMKWQRQRLETMAGFALQALVAREHGNMSPKSLAGYAYEYAGEMITLIDRNMVMAKENVGKKRKV